MRLGGRQILPILDRVWVDGGCAGQSRSESAVAAFRCPRLLCSPSSFSTSHIVNGVLRSLGMSPEVHSWYRVQALTNRHQTLTDLNDFITPSQACIKPVEQTNKPEPQDAGAAAVCSCRPSAYSVFANLIDGRRKFKSIQAGPTTKSRRVDSPPGNREQGSRS